MQIRNRLAEIRRMRGISASALAGRAEVRRQTIYAIEAGTYVPNTLVSLRLARVLDVTVEEIFTFDDKPTAPQVFRDVEVLASHEPLRPGQPMRLCQVGKYTVGIPSQPFPGVLPLADGVHVKTVGAGRATVKSLEGENASGKRLLIAGCDPAVSILGRFVEKEAEIELVAANCSSLQALKWLRDGKVHIAGSHLRDAKTGESNLPIVKKLLPGGGYKIITYALWEQGLVVAKGNPKNVMDVSDLARVGVTLINREKGAGSRLLLDELLAQSGVNTLKVEGYSRLAPGHIAAAGQVYSGDADCCVATRGAARTWGLDFIPLSTERYDLIITNESLEMRSVQILLDIVNRTSLQRKLAALAEYDMSQAGHVMV